MAANLTQRPQSFYKYAGAKGGRAPRSTKHNLAPGDRFVKIVGCVRCGKNHSLTAKPLTNPTDEYKFYALCPSFKTRQPILIKVL